MTAMFILYVQDQERSRAFYEALLGLPPKLHVPGMTEFALGETASLGLMPEQGIRRLLGDALPEPTSSAGAPRAELYLRVDDAAARHRRAVGLGARELSAPAARGWGDLVGYVLDLDGYVLAFGQAQ